MKRAGFSLMEVILVIGVIGTVTGMAVPLYRDYQIRNDLNMATEQVTQGLGRARLLALSGEQDSDWGFYAPAGILYKGNSYDERDEAFDETYAMPSTIVFTGLYEVSYGKLQGKPSSTGAITLTALNQEQRFVFIEVQSETVAIVESDKLTICHSPPGNPENANTITITESAWPTHRDNHGDTLGPCSGGAASSQSSTAEEEEEEEEEQASSSSSAAPVVACENRFSVAEDGTMTVAGPLSVRFDSLGAQFGYGNGGPTVPVKVYYKKNSNGNSWQKLFGGNAINGNGGATQTVTNFATGDQVILKFHAYYKQRNWLTYDNTVVSNDGSQSVIVLRNGDPSPTITGANGQASISTLLQPITLNGNISIGEYDAVLLADFNRASCSSCNQNYCSNCTGVDYQDGVVLVKFLAPSC